MCGIVALIPKTYLSQQEVNYFKQALYVDALRGFDGTGIFRIDHKDQAEVYKIAAPAGVLLKKLNDDKKTLYGKALVGHNRSSTRGANTINNTHPFQEKNITLIHNGTLYSHKHLKDVDVDSHAICHTLTDHTPQETVNKIDGAYALIWYDENTKNLNLLRNNERPLWMFTTKDFWFICSEKEMGDWILTRNDIDILKSETVKEDTLYSMSMDKKEWLCKPCKQKKKSYQTIPWTEKVSYHPQTLSIQDKSYESFLNHLSNYFNINIKDLVDVIFTNKEKTPSGLYYRYTGHLDISKAYKVNLYTNSDIPLNSIAEVKVSAAIAEGNGYILLCTINEDSPEQLVTPYKTKSGTTVTKLIHNSLLNKKCSYCNEKYTPNTGIDIGMTLMNDVVISYTFTCPKCTEEIKQAKAA